ncbi:hypothetical protein ACQ4PT_048851 [Festuca glaucescens]
MVKKKGAATASSAAASTTGPKAATAASKKVTPETSAAVTKDAPGDWPVSTMTKRDEKKARSLGLISDNEEDVLLPGSDSRPNPPAGFTVMFAAFLYRGLSLPAHEFLRCLLLSYGIQLWELTPNSILHLAIFITRCEAFLGIDPHWGLWKKIFFVKRYSSSNGSFITGGVGFVVRKEVNYFNFLMRESVQGWRLKWFYLRDPSTAGRNTCLPKFVDVLEAMPKKSWKNILTAEEKVVADKLYERILEIKNTDGQTMIGTEDETQINVAELSEKELLDEVRRLTHFSQEDSIPLLALHEPYDLTHQPAEVPAAVKYFPAVSGVEEDPEDGDSTANVEPYAEVVEGSETSKEEDNNPFNPEAPSAKHKILDDELIDTAESSQHDNDADHVPFVTTAPETSSAQPPKRPSGGFADEDDLLLDFEEGFLEPPSKKAKTNSNIPTPAASEAPALSKEVLASSSLLKEKENLSASGGHSIQAAVTIIKDFASQFTLLQAENARLQQDIQSSFAQLDQAVKIAATAQQDADSLRKELGQLKKKLKEEEKAKTEAQAQVKEKEDLLFKSTTALLGATDIPVNSVGKLPADTAADAISLAIESGEFVRALLQKNKAVLSRFHAMIFPKADQNKTLGQLVDTFSIDTEGIIEVFKRSSSGPFVEDVSATGSETGLLQQMRTRISRMEKDLLGIHAMAAVIKKKGEMAVEAERYTLNELQKAIESLNCLRMIWKAMFPLDPVLPTLLALMSNFRNAERVRALVRSQLLAGAETALAFVLSQHPLLNLEAIAKSDGNVSQYFPAVRDPASIVVARLEISSEANYAVEAFHE